MDVIAPLMVSSSANVNQNNEDDVIDNSETTSIEERPAKEGGEETEEGESEEGEGGAVDATLLESVEPEDIHHLQHSFQTLYDIGENLGKRVWTDFFDTLLPAKLKFPQFSEKTVKSMMFDPDFVAYHQEINDRMHDGLSNLHDMELADAIFMQIAFEKFPQDFVVKDLQQLVESYMKVMRGFLQEMFMAAEGAWTKLSRRLVRLWMEGILAAKAAKLEEERRRLLYPNINRDELMLPCEVELVQKAFKIATKEPHKFGITLMKNLFEMSPLHIDRFPIFKDKPLHEIVAMPEFRRYGMSGTYAVVPIVDKLPDDILIILECERYVKTFVYPNELEDPDVCAFKDAFVKSVSDWINFPVGDAFPFAERSFEKAGDLIMEIFSVALRELKKDIGDYPPKPPTHRQLTEWEKRNLRRIVGEDIQETQEGRVPYLSDIAIQFIVNNFRYYACQQQYISPKFLPTILDRLPLDLPLLVTTRWVDYEPYWKRKCGATWRMTDPAQYGVDVGDGPGEGGSGPSDSVGGGGDGGVYGGGDGSRRSEERKRSSGRSGRSNRSRSRASGNTGGRGTEASGGGVMTTDAANGGGDEAGNVVIGGVDGVGVGGEIRDAYVPGRSGPYKTAFFERTLAEKIEQIVPHDSLTFAERSKDIAEFLTHAKFVVKKLKIEQLFGSRPVEPVDEWEKPEEEEEGQENVGEEKGSEDSGDGGEEVEEPERDFFIHLRGERMDHVDLTPILAELPLIESLDICYRVKYVVDNFEWRLFNLTLSDCSHLADAIFSTDSLRVVKLANSGVNCDKLRVLTSGLGGHPGLQELDLSHNCIQASGMRSLWMVLKHRDCRLHTLNLYDNDLGDAGGQNLARVLEKYPGYLRSLNLRLNGLGDAAAARICVALLPTPDDVEWPEWKPPKPLAEMIDLNLAANSLSNGCVDQLIELVSRTKTLKNLDVSCNNFVVEQEDEESLRSSGDYAAALTAAASAPRMSGGGIRESESTPPKRRSGGGSSGASGTEGTDINELDYEEEEEQQESTIPDSIPIRLIKALIDNESLRRFDVRLAGFDTGLQEVIDERLEGRLDADANVLEYAAQERRIERIVKPKVEAKMKKIFPHHFVEKVQKRSVRSSEG